jgi:ankyrin repeat protein
MHCLSRFPRGRAAVALAFLVAVAPPAASATRDSRLADAVERQDRAAVATLLKARPDVNAVNAPQPDGATALQWAAHWDDRETVGALLRAGAKVNAANDHGVTALALATENRSSAIVEMLLGAGANPNSAVSTGETVLMTAARTGSVPIVQALLAGGANVNATESLHAQNALMWATAQQHAEVVRLLIAGGADVHARSRVRRRTVQVADRYGDQNSVRGVTEVDLGGFTPLLFAARVGDVESAAHLLDAGADVNDPAPYGASVLVVATHSGHGRVARLLLDRGADPNAAAAGYTALHAAVLRSDLQLVNALLARGARPDVPLAKGTPSRYYSKDYAFNENLVGATPYWLAARYGEPEIMGALAGAGADPRFAMKDGTTALIAAIVPTRGLGTFRAGDRRERYQGPADVAAKGQGEDEALTLATAKRALELGADVNAATQAGDTALHIASGLAANTVVQLLAEHGALLDQKNKRGLTPLGVATAQAPRAQVAVGYFALPDDRTATASLLRQLGAKD